MPKEDKKDITLESLMGEIMLIKEQITGFTKKTDSGNDPEEDPKPNPAVSQVTEFLKSQVTAKTDSDVKDWNLDQLLGAFNAIQSIKKKVELPDAPKIKVDSKDETPDVLKARLPKPGEVRI
ncbi:MAG: hypothetical protein GY834_09875 [Bacteroidetes bacterium]|nr:hypothetical protein [Bacteroidota bacterium]